MTDNNMQESEIKTSEQPFNPEMDHQTPVTFIYRGENPYMKSLVDAVKARGLNIDVRQLPVEETNQWVDEARDKDPEDESVKQGFGKLVNCDLSGILVTDNSAWTYEARGLNLLGSREYIVNAYDLLETSAAEEKSESDIVEVIRPLVEQIRAAGKTPVVVPANLTDHRDGVKKSVVNESLGDIQQIAGQVSRDLFLTLAAGGWPGNGFDAKVGLVIAIIYRHHLGVVIASLQLINRDNERYERTEDLNSEYQNAENPVFLVDHHFTYKSPGEYSGLFDIPEHPEIALICSCCVNRNDTYQELAMEKGYEIFPFALEKGQIDPIADSLVAKIKERQVVKQAESQ